MPATLLSDTDPTAEKVQVEILRSMGAAGKFQVLNDLIITGQVLSLSCLWYAL